MASSPALPLTPIVDVTVLAGPALGSPPTFNQGLIIGSSAVIPTVGTGVLRLRQYTSLAGMVTDGFTTSEPEYLAAQLYFSQTPSPEYVWIGRQNLTALANGALDAPGTGYAVGDVGTIAGGTAGKLATYEVLTITGGGGTGPVGTFAILTGGDGYTAAVGVATTATTGSGTGLTITTTGDVGESALSAFTACRNANSTWYAGMVCSTADADINAIAAYAEAATPQTFFYAVTSDANVLNGVTGNVAAVLKGDNYQHTALIYSTTQGGAASNNAYAEAAAMGLEMGLNTQLPNSYFTMWGKVLVGVTAEPITQAQINSINGNNCNVYVGYVNQYTLFQPGITPSGVYIDQVLNRAILQANLQYGLMNLLVSVAAVPQTDPGEQQLIHVCNTVCQAAVETGYLAQNGTYEGVQPVINLYPGDPIPAGFVCQAYSFSTQSAANKDARQAMPIYIVINESGAVQSLTVGVLVNL